MSIGQQRIRIHGNTPFDDDLDMNEAYYAISDDGYVRGLLTPDPVLVRGMPPLSMKS